MRYKRTILWIVPIAVLGSLIYFFGASEIESDNDYIAYIKTVSLLETSPIPAKEVLENTCTDGSWVYFETSNRKRVVEFKGKCPIDDAIQPVNLQVLVEKDKSEYKLGAMLVNNVQQEPEDRQAFIQKLYSN